MVNKLPEHVLVFDTTLRDGGQSEDVSFSVQDKISITHFLNDFGVHYVEGGWPGSNPKDEEYFSAIQKDLSRLKTKVTCFGSTRRRGVTCEKDENIQKLKASNVPVACIFGKTWDFHVKEALKIPNEENLELIFDSIAYLKKSFEEVIFDAEHFFDGYKSNPKYALETLNTAKRAGADILVLCDTNGGTMPWEIQTIIDDVNKQVDAPLGIHTHNDAENAVSNCLFAVRQGAVMVQGTVNGFGERCGNCNLISVIANLHFKMNIPSVPAKSIDQLTLLSGFVREKANMPTVKNQPYTGRSAFAHKGGIHVSAVMNNSRMYEHIDPTLVGNTRRVLISDLAGLANIRFKIKETELGFVPTEAEMKKIRTRIKHKENQGYLYESADASFVLEILRTLNRLPEFFTVLGYRVFDYKTSDSDDTNTEASVQIKTLTGEIIHTVSLGRGPVDALSNALKKALGDVYTIVNESRLVDYKVRILNSDKGTSATTRVLIRFEHGDMQWETVGVHYDIIRASYLALTDSMYYLIYSATKNTAKHPE